MLASLLASAPILSLPVFLYGVVKVQSLLPEAEASLTAISHWTFIVLMTMLISIVGLPLGATAHAIVAARTNIYPRYAWWLILLASVITLFYPPVGTVVGIVVIVLLFTLQTFKNMRGSNKPLQATSQ